MRHVLAIVVQVAVWRSDRFDALMLGLSKNRPGVFERVNFRRWATVQIFAYFSALGPMAGNSAKFESVHDMRSCLSTRLSDVE